MIIYHIFRQKLDLKAQQWLLRSSHGGNLLSLSAFQVPPEGIFFSILLQLVIFFFVFYFSVPSRNYLAMVIQCSVGM